MNTAAMPHESRLQLYWRLVRADKPIGILLLLWPTLIALWLAANGHPDWRLVVIFSIGTALMRSAGCAINDWADRDFDRHVKRTVDRPLTSGKISGREALAVAATLAIISFLLILPFLNLLTLQLSVVAVLLAATYPFFKRFFPVPQAYLGIAYGFGIPMAYAATLNAVPFTAWLLLAGSVLWTIAYDTEYAMVDRDDDIRIGLKSSALTFGRYDVAIIMLCYAAWLLLVLFIGWQAGLRSWFIAGWLLAVGCAIYHYQLIRERERMRCFAAFLHNSWLGAALFAGVALDYALS
ncbi:4-hydroxybenzoate polyprenyltransferase [Paucimonas lemoignei]|uniref:4-hydroxybenzoate octaprenyltransferase n=2 Tax=Paucimonas lemoignei TaxID=29443 RepID=A0A4R3I0S8_PAULE|nr:4-hydroxybenzoate polyprenyltransferase [Paucimonas lemoignei]